MEETRFLCDLPWKHLSVHPHGVCSVCCVANHADGQSAASRRTPDGGWEKMNIKEGIPAIVNSDSFKEVRKMMVEGKVPPACKTCWDVEEAGGVSKRQKDSHYKVDVDKSTKPDGSIAVDLMNVELRLGNYCNLKCRSCNAESSTSWIDDYKKLKNKIIFPSNYDELQTMKYTDYSWVENEDFYDEVLKYSPRIDQLHISGGEPFLVPKHFYFLDKLIEDDLAKDMKIFYITNANYDFDKIKPALEKLRNFQFVGISISIDDVDERNSYIRKNSNWKVTIRNLGKFLSEYGNYPNFHFSVTQTINTFNFMYVEELSQFLLERGMYKFDGTGPIKRIISNHVHAPDYQNALVIPKNFRQQKLEEIKGLVDDNFYDDVYKMYYTAESNGQSGYFMQSTETLDKFRRESWADIFPRLYSSLKKTTI